MQGCSDMSGFMAGDAEKVASYHGTDSAACRCAANCRACSAVVCHCPVLQIYGASSKSCKIAPLLSSCLLCLQGLRACAAGAEPAELLIRCESVCLQLLAPLKWLHVSRCLCSGSVCTHKYWPLEVAAAIHTPSFCVHHPTSAGRNAEAAPVFMLSVVVLLQVGCDAQPQVGGTHGTLRWLRFTPLMAALRCIHRKHCLRRHTFWRHTCLQPPCWTMMPSACL